MTYSSLKTDMERYMERGGSVTSDPVVAAQIPRLINQAERNLAVKLKIQGTQETIEDFFETGNNVVVKPTRWRETISWNFLGGVSMNQRTPLFVRSYEYCRLYWPNDATTAAPKFYADYDYYHWLIAGTPDQDYPYEILYWQLPPLLDDSNQVNWLTEQAPRLLLFAALVEGAIFIKNAGLKAEWDAEFQKTLQDFNVQDLRKIADRDSKRVTS